MYLFTETSYKVNLWYHENGPYKYGIYHQSFFITGQIKLN